MSLSSINDFSDRISPVLVKELRQGMRAKLFTALFLGLQIFLSIVLLAVSSASSGTNGGNMLSGIIFTFFSIALLVLQPLRGVNALHGEIKENTIDMMVLTKLDASRIVLGKWVAIVGQSTLLLATVAPYLILRYFFGGMELFEELMLMFLIFCTSLALTAITVGLSACTNIFIRGLLPLVSLPAVFIGLFALAISARYGGPTGPSLTSPETWYGIGACLLFLAYIGYSFLSMGASLIAPAAENHSIIRRLAAILLLIAAGFAGYFGGYDKGIHYAAIFLTTVPAIIIALTESAPPVDSAVKSFVRFGFPGRLCGKFLAPTWQSGVCFSLLFFPLACLAFGLHRNAGGYHTMNDAERWIIFLSLLGGLYFPAVWQTFLFRGDGQRLTHYLLILTGSIVMLWVLSLIASSTDSQTVLYAFFWHPFASLSALNYRGPDEEATLIGLIALLLAYFLILGIKVLILFRKDKHPIITHE